MPDASLFCCGTTVEMSGDDVAEAGEWVVAARSRLQQQLGTESVEYPGRLATCPKGHVRALPSRFSRREFPLRCHTCRRDYTFREPDAGAA
jgi:hypothetical protein